MRLLPLAALSLFVALDLAANWRLGGMVSVSEQVWALVMVALASHLGLRWPLGPG